MKSNNMKGINTILLAVEPKLEGTMDSGKDDSKTFIFDKDEFASEFSWNQKVYSNDDFSIANVDYWGGEGEGDSAGFVLKFTALTTEALNKFNEYDFYGKEFYVKFPAYYDSWEGFTWREPELVKPVPKTITTWESI